MRTNQKNMRYPDHQHEHDLQKWKFLGIQQKNKKILWSELDWLVNYTPPPIGSKEPDWRKCKLL